MKSKIFSLLLLLVFTMNYAQSEKVKISIEKMDKLVYLDSTRNETSKKKHKFYRIIKDYYIDQDFYKIYDYYKTGVLQMEGTSTKKDGISKEGQFIYYYENGNKQKAITYLSNKLLGKTTKWYENGNIQEEGEFIDIYKEIGRNYKLNQFWDMNGNHLIVDGNGFHAFKNTMDFQESGNYKNGFKDGVFEGKNPKDNSSFSEKYENGKFISGKRIFDDGTIKEYFDLERRPYPKSGLKDFYSFIGKNFKQSKESALNKISGKILVKFVVDKDGKIVEPEIIRGLDYLLDEEAIRVLLKYGDWIPGEQRGMKVRCTFSLPIDILPM